MPRARDGKARVRPLSYRPLTYMHIRTCTQEDRLLQLGVKKYSQANWPEIANMVKTRTTVQCRQRWQKVLKPGLKKGQWKSDEDEKLRTMVKRIGMDWSKLSMHVEGRTAKQCRERWKHHLDPSVSKSEWTPSEDQIILDLHAKLGNKWSKIAKKLPGRTANAVKIRRTTLRRRDRNKKKKASGTTSNSSRRRTAQSSLLPELPEDVKSYLRRFEGENMERTRSKTYERRRERHKVPGPHAFNPIPLPSPSPTNGTRSMPYPSFAKLISPSNGMALADRNTSSFFGNSSDSLLSDMSGLFKSDSPNVDVADWGVAQATSGDNSSSTIDMRIPRRQQSSGMPVHPWIPPPLRPQSNQRTLSMGDGVMTTTTEDESVSQKKISNTMSISSPTPKVTPGTVPARTGSKTLSSELHVTTGDLLELEGYISKDLSDSIKSLGISDLDNLLTSSDVSKPETW